MNKEDLDFFERHKCAWIGEGHEGRWVAIANQKLLGFNDTFEGALAAAIAIGSEPFLVKQLLPEEPVRVVHRVFASEGSPV